MITAHDARRIAALHAIPAPVAAALYAAGHNAGHRAVATDVTTNDLAGALLGAVDTLPRIGERIAGTLPTDPAPALPDLDVAGLTATTPPPPTALPATRWLLWEWANATAPATAAALAADPESPSVTGWPDPGLTRDPYGADPAPFVAYLIHAHAAAAAFRPYAGPVAALHELDRLAATPGPVDVPAVAALAQRARADAAVPTGVRARADVLHRAGAARLADVVDAAIRARTRWTADGYPLGIVDRVSHDDRRRVARALDRVVAHMTDDNVVAAADRVTIL